jgi:hypothetical protein
MSQGVPLKTISDLLGHASIEVTADIYLHSTDVHVRDTARLVERTLGRSGSPSEGKDCCPACGRPLTSTEPQLGADVWSSDWLAGDMQVRDADAQPLRV